jgi:hypothetical protein
VASAQYRLEHDRTPERRYEDQLRQNGSTGSG